MLIDIAKIYYILPSVLIKSGISMALTQEQKNEITKAMEETAAAQAVVVENFEKLLNLDSFNAIRSFEAVYPGNDSRTAHPIFDDLTSTVSESLIEAMMKCSNEEEDLQQFITKINYIYQPRLYNYYKAGCFIMAEDEVKRDYPAILEYEHHHTKVSHTFNTPLEYYAWKVDMCKDKYDEKISIDAEIEEHILHTKGELEKLSNSAAHTHYDL